jgi:hypothetical protein
MSRHFFGPLGPVPGAAFRYSSFGFVAGFFLFAAETSLTCVAVRPDAPGSR